ncbi:MAG: hypothetical protein RR921_08010 [Mucinivorans sp.]
MKKMMFNDRYGQTEAVIEKRKTVTRRLVKPIIDGVDQVGWKKWDYKVGEIVAIAQSYKDCGEFDVYEAPKDTAGWKNKMFVKAELMPRKIRITGVRAEKLQAITEEDCLREGIRLYRENSDKYFIRGLYENKISPCAISQRVGIEYGPVLFSSPRDTYAALIDKISGKGTWNANPWVWRIEFELIK